ncbi:MAG: restriction endonuclease [Nitrospinales bacterium]
MNPSAFQMVLAEQYGIALPKNCTFVGPYKTGLKPKEQIFISRSAINCLYQTIEYPKDYKLKPDWFKFERDVYTLMKNLKYSVTHIAASKNGDNGIDVYAKKGKIEWIIQCKCWSPRYPVGPNIIRELMGTLIGFPNARGMVVTTSHFTSGAIQKADEHNIEHIDGAEFIDWIDDVKKK